MNRLIIVGNGFDIHHGLKSDYTSFIKWYLKNICLKAIEKINHKELGLDVSFIGGGGAFVESYYKIEEVVERIFALETNFKNRSFNYQGVSYQPICKIENGFLNDLLTFHGDLKWVDIELIYYNNLKRILSKLDIVSQKEIINQISKLNNELETIKNNLAIYLREIDSKFVGLRFNKFLDENLEIRHVLEKDHLVQNKKRFPESIINNDKEIRFQKTLVVNFNYTSLIKGLDPRPDVNSMNIHGSIEDLQNPPIFGYGDEIDEDYLKMEKSNINEFLTNIKSFGYFNNSNYFELSRFINNDSFVVYTWGHSCGLSDRTLLNFIFEHDNCTLIKPFYWKRPNGTNNYTELTQNISRHFKDKLKMRNRVLNISYCDHL